MSWMQNTLCEHGIAATLEEGTVDGIKGDGDSARRQAENVGVRGFQ